MRFPLSCPSRRLDIDRTTRWFGPTLRLTLLVAFVWTVIGSAPLSAQRSEREARGFVSSVAEFVYNLAWPTATYDGFGFGRVQRVTGGYDVPVEISGTSGFSGDSLGLVLVFQFRNGSLENLYVQRHNAIIAPPFATAATMGAVIYAIAQEMATEQRQASVTPSTPPRTVMAPSPAPSMTQEVHDRRDAAMLVGTWRDENSVFTYFANGRMMCEWDTGERMYGTWSIHADTLTWHYPDGDHALYILESLGTSEHRTRSLADGSVWNARRTSYR